MNIPSHIKTYEIHIRGLIQGVGFRPFIYKLALEHKLHGFVRNQNNGVIIHAQGEDVRIQEFFLHIQTKLPASAEINSINKKRIASPLYNDFSISASKTIDNSITRVSPDIAVCDDCLKDMSAQPHRKDYSFVNCTHCGPRFSIIENIPYDRKFTSMSEFSMCEICKSEYTSVLDRRFHAQPVACNNCGPVYSMHVREKSFSDIEVILEQAKYLIETGGVLAIKGLGGFHLACNAFNEAAIQKLRKVKVRDGKPFALMFRDIDAVKKFSALKHQEEKVLNSWQRPIVLIESTTAFPSGVADNLKTIGVFLPYMPFHYQLFNVLNTPALVMTSGNITHCPIITSNRLALDIFRDNTDGVIIHNRRIVNRVDDSVVHLINHRPQLLRRSRGYTPSPIQLQFTTEGIFGAGAELANTFCIGKGKEAILSQHIGDLKNLETSEFYENSLETFKRLFDFTPKHVVCDMHPEYLSTKFARSLGLPIFEVQHHHAHIASCMAEHNLDEPVIGVAYDGTGYGTDGKIWGSEIMVASLDDFERKYHFEYIPIPGGDKVSEQPWRSTIAYLHHYFGKNLPMNFSFTNNLSKNEVQLVLQALANNINSPESCSAGRLFDAVSALLNICSTASYHAEAPILLENAIDPGTTESYQIDLGESISWKNTFKCIIDDLKNNVPVNEISTKFHNTLIEVTLSAIKKIHAETGISTVILSGGTFQNKYISKNLLDLLHLTGLKGYMSSRIPVNDGGLSLGQVAIAAKKLALCV